MYDLTSAVCVALIEGRVLHAKSQEADATAGNGRVIDWRTVKSGVTVVEDVDVYDAAVAFIQTAGWAAVANALDADGS